MFYCVETTYRAGGNVSCHVYTIHSVTKPLRQEVEELHRVVVRKYFNYEAEAIDYANRFGVIVE